jgi:hypothetical protein
MNKMQEVELLTAAIHTTAVLYRHWTDAKRAAKFRGEEPEFSFTSETKSGISYQIAILRLVGAEFIKRKAKGDAMAREKVSKALGLLEPIDFTNCLELGSARLDVNDAHSLIYEAWHLVHDSVDLDMRLSVN